MEGSSKIIEIKNDLKKPTGNVEDIGMQKLLIEKLNKRIKELTDEKEKIMVINPRDFRERKEEINKQLNSTNIIAENNARLASKEAQLLTLQEQVVASNELVT